MAGAIAVSNEDSGSSAGKESTCNAGNPGLIPGSGSPPWRRDKLHTPVVAQMVKNPPTVRETWVRSLGWEDLLEKGTATPLQDSGLENSMAYYRGHKESDTTEQFSHSDLISA